MYLFSALFLDGDSDGHRCLGLQEGPPLLAVGEGEDQDAQQDGAHEQQEVGCQLKIKHNPLESPMAVFQVSLLGDI